jgi:hypothetical protein
MMRNGADAWTALAAYATVTTRVRQGPMSYVLHRGPLMTARLDAKISALDPSFAHETRRNMGTPRDVIQLLPPVIEAGIDYMVGNLTAYGDIEMLTLLAEQVAPESASRYRRQGRLTIENERSTVGG